ncbi:MAG TPA: hypothetical protein VI564_00850 [Candidatus Nanoarchaeia archaeon]|nr:hypothetical protein [Candidatus Nanoarchaeia archaeon]
MAVGVHAQVAKNGCSMYEIRFAQNYCRNYIWAYPGCQSDGIHFCERVADAPGWIWYSCAWSGPGCPGVMYFSENAGPWI